MCWRAAYSIMCVCVAVRACWQARMKPRVIVYPFPCYRSVVVSCSLSLTLELWQGFRLSWQEGVLDKTDLFHLIWKMSPLPYDHFSDSLSCQWESGHCAHSLSRGTNGLFFLLLLSSVWGILSAPLVTLKGQKLRPRHDQIHHPIHAAQGEKSTVSTKGKEEDKIYLAFKGHKPFRINL